MITWRNKHRQAIDIHKKLEYLPVISHHKDFLPTLHEAIGRRSKEKKKSKYLQVTFIHLS